MPKPPAVKSVWFLPRTRDQPVVSAIRLGDIIESPWVPEEALNDKPPPNIGSASLRRQEEKSWSWTKEIAQSGGGGVFASFLQFLGIGGDIEGTLSKKHTEVYEVDRMLTEEFLPDKRYLAQCIQNAGVQDAFVGPARKSRVYMVTGLKIAYGATKATEMMKERGIHAQIGVDASSLGVPITIGPKIDWSSGVTESLAGGKSDFVFAFKLRRLKYKKGVLTDKAFTQGARYGLSPDGQDMNDEDEDVLDVEDFDVDDIEDDTAEEFMMHTKGIPSTEIGGEEIQLFFPG